MNQEQTVAIVPAITEWVVDRLMSEHQQFVQQQDLALRGHALQLALACLHGREQTRACFQAWLAQGMALDTLYLQVLAPAARLVGQWWQADSVDFAHCTVGHSHLQDLLVEFSPQFLAQSSGYATPAGHRWRQYQGIKGGKPTHRKGARHSTRPAAKKEPGNLLTGANAGRGDVHDGTTSSRDNPSYQRACS